MTIINKLIHIPLCFWDPPMNDLIKASSSLIIDSKVGLLLTFLIERDRSNFLYVIKGVQLDILMSCLFSV